MLDLILIRHAKSSWDDPAMADIDRPLNSRGKKNAPFMARILKGLGLVPDLLICSNAKRSESTARKMAAELGYDKERIRIEPKIYEASVKSLLSIINHLKDQQKMVALVGHNPSITEFLNYISGTDIVNMPTACVAHVRFDCDSWKEISKDTGHLVYFDYPKNYPENRNEA